MGAVLGTLLLLVGAWLGVTAFIVETCTGNAPDALLLWPIVMIANLLGFAALGWASRPRAIAGLALLPAIAALDYSINAALLAGGVPACELIAGHDGWEQTPDHAELVMQWLATAASFWLGFGAALWRGTCRHAEKDLQS